MRNPLTADEREKRVAEYLLTLNRGQIAAFRLTRLNRVANFRRSLMQLMEEFIEARAEVLAAGMLMEYEPERPKKVSDVAEGRLPLPELSPRKARRIPPWLSKTPARGFNRGR